MVSTIAHTEINRNSIPSINSYDDSKAWDGRFKGKDLPIGTYYYIIDIDDGKTNPVTGAVTLIR